MSDSEKQGNKSSENLQNEDGESKPRRNTSKRSRDNFTQATINTLARRVNYHCSNPEHGVTTVGPHSDPHKAKNIGEAAHIEAAAGSGPRANPTLSEQERKDINNGIWLCSNCHDIVDSDEKKYTVAVLRQWKLQAEQRAESELGVSMPWLHRPGESGELLLLEPPPEDELPEPGRLPQGSWVPFLRNKVFTGREADLMALAKLLLYEPLTDTAGVGLVETVAATGIGGIGKTQIAVEFCYRYGRYFRGVHWVAANEDIPAGIALCGEKMALENWPQEQPDQVQITLQVLQKSSPRLVVLDNLENPQVLQAWLPELGNVRVLVTARREKWPTGLPLSKHPVGVMNESESRQLLRELVPRLEHEPDENLDPVGERLGYLPLALDLAGRYLNDRRTLSPNGFLEEVEKAGSALEHSALKDWTEHNPTQHEVNLAKTFLQSWVRLESKGAKLLFRVCGYCAPNTPITWAVLQASAEVEEARLDRGLGRLEDLGLVTLGETGAVVHPLLAEFARAVDEEAEESALPGLVSALGDLSYEALEKGLPELFKPLRPHMETAAKAAEETRLEGAGWLWNILGNHLRMVAEYERAKKAFERALLIRKEKLGDKHTDTATTLNDLANLLKDMGDYATAKRYLEQVINIYENEFGKQHSWVATAVNNLGNVLRALGDYAGAKAAYERALAIDEAAFGPDHPNVAIRVNNLGVVLKALGDYAGAKAAYERALAIWEVELGPDHPQVAVGTNNLGLVLKDLGDYAGAKAVLERALAIWEVELGPDHPQVAIGTNNLGSVLQDLGDYAGAKAAYERSLEIKRRYFPEDHPSIQLTLNNLASLEEEIKRQ